MKTCSRYRTYAHKSGGFVALTMLLSTSLPSGGIHAKEIYGGERTSIEQLNANILNALNDDQFVSNSAKKDLHLVTAINYGSGNKKFVDFNKTIPFQIFTGTTSEAVKRYSELYSGDQISAMIYANSTFFGGGYLYGGNAQEESVVRDMNPVTISHLIGRNLVSKIKHDGIVDAIYPEIPDYLSKISADDGTIAVSPAIGYLIDARLDYTNAVTNQRPIKFKALFAALPSLNRYVFDKNSFILYSALFGDSADFTLDVHPEDDDSRKRRFKDSLSFVKRIWSECALNDDDFKKAVIIYMFSDVGSRFKHGEETALRNLERYAKAKEGDPDFEVFKNANNEYTDRLHELIRAWIIMARENGVKCFIGGPIGCGVFRNDVNTVAQIFAEEFIQYGGDMLFVCTGSNSKTSILFEKEFSKAWNKFKTAAENK